MKKKKSVHAEAEGCLNFRLLAQFCQNKFILLKEIAEDYAYQRKQIFTVKTLRNKIKVEMSEINYPMIIIGKHSNEIKFCPKVCAK